MERQKEPHDNETRDSSMRVLAPTMRCTSRHVAFLCMLMCFVWSTLSVVSNHLNYIDLDKAAASAQTHATDRRDTLNGTGLDQRRILCFEDWPVSRIELLWQNTNSRARVDLPSSPGAQPVLTCPQCRSFLAGSVLGKRILLLGHELKFGGGEILLYNVGKLLQESGAHVRFLFLCPPGPLLQRHLEEGFSHQFWTYESDMRYQVDFDGFDAVLSNTVTIDKWFNFFDDASSYLSTDAYDKLLQKTIYWVHEFNKDEWLADNDRTLPSILTKVHRVLFDSKAGRNVWLGSIPAIENKSDVVWPGVNKQLIKELVEPTKQPGAQRLMRQKLNIPAGDQDVVILQASSVSQSKGHDTLIEAFSLFIESLSSEVKKDRAWFLVLKGFPPDPEGISEFIIAITERADEINKHFIEQGSRSRIILRKATIQVAPYYTAADMFILNSECENFGMVVVEAMFARLPVITRDCGGPVEAIVNGTTGFILPKETDNVRALVSIFRETTTSSKWRKRLSNMGGFAQERAKKHFSYARMARELSNVFTRLFFFSESRPAWRCSASTKRESGVDTERSFDQGHDPPCPRLPESTTYDMQCAAVGSSLYVFGGYQSLDSVTKEMELYNLNENSWTRAPPLPENAAESHAAVAHDKRFIYSLSGQRGAECRRPVNASFVFDTARQAWSEIPELPVARYAACAAVLHDKLHFVGGMDVDRRTARTEHYSMSLDELSKFIFDNGAIPEWRLEPPVPTGSGHVACEVLRSHDGMDKLYYFGGEAEDYYPRDPDAGDFSCIPGVELNNPFVHVYDGENWERGQDMPYPLSHVESFTITTGEGGPLNSALFFGGSGLHEEFRGDVPVISDGILWFSARTERFKRIGSLFPIGAARKGSCSVGWVTKHKNGTDKLRIMTLNGQRSESPSVPWPGPIEPFALICDADGVPWIDTSE